MSDFGSQDNRQRGKKPIQQAVIKEEKEPFECSNTLIEVGAEFDSYDSLVEAIKAYEAANYVNLIIRDTRSVEVAQKRNRRKNYNPTIKYSDVCYCCTYGGKKFQSRSTGKRIHKSTKQACPFNLKVRATPDGQRLFIREMCTFHNHEISEADFRLHPKQRKLDQVSQEQIASLLSLEPDKRLLREKLMQVTGKVILMKDIHNIKTRLVESKSKNQLLPEPDLHLDDNDSTKVGCHHQMTVVELVDDLTEASQRLTSNPQEGSKRELLSNTLSIQIPMAHIEPDDLPSVLNSIVSALPESVIAKYQQEDQTQLTIVNSAVEESVNKAASISEFPAPVGIFPGALESFSHPLPPPPHSSQDIYHHDASQPLLSEVVSSVIVPPSPSPVNLPESSGVGDTRHPSFNPLEDVAPMGMSILPSLPPWHDLDIVSVERPNFQTSVSPSHSAKDSDETTMSAINGSLSDGQMSRLSPVSTPDRNARHLDSNHGLQFFHLPQSQHANQEHQMSTGDCRTKDKIRGSNSRPVLKKLQGRRNAVTRDKEAIKRKYFQQASVNLFFNERFSFHQGHHHVRDSARFSSFDKQKMTTTKGCYHEMLQPLAWLFGTWRGENGKGIYPTIEDFTYAETADFFPVAQKPIVEYKLYSTKPDGCVPLHRETGFIRIKPNTNHIAFVAAHNFGLSEVQEGEVKACQLTVETTGLTRVSFNKAPVVKKVQRTFQLKGQDLEQVMWMETENTQMTEHLRITYKKCDA